MAQEANERRSYLYNETFPQEREASHIATRSMWVERKRGASFEYTYAELDQLVPGSDGNQTEREGLKAALVSIHRHEVGSSPTANFGRLPSGYENLTNGELPLSHDPCCTHADTLAWENVENPSDDDWLGLDWTADPTEVDSPVLFKEPTDDGFNIGSANSAETAPDDTQIAGVPNSTTPQRRELREEARGIKYLSENN